MNVCAHDPCDHVLHYSCTQCGREQYGPVVLAVSHGELRCPWCHEFNQVTVRMRSA
jgi:hypothetical protein